MHGAGRRRGKARPQPAFHFLALVLLLLASCGYHLTPVGGIVPQGAKSIAIPVFLNDTKEPYLDVMVTKAVVEEFLTDGRLQVVGPDAADLILHGTVTHFTLTPQSYSPEGYATSYNVGISVQVSLEDARTHKVVMPAQDMSSIFYASYAQTVGDITATKIARESAIQSASQDLAATLRSRVLEGF